MKNEHPHVVMKVEKWWKLLRHGSGAY